MRPRSSRRLSATRRGAPRVAGSSAAWVLLFLEQVLQDRLPSSTSIRHVGTDPISGSVQMGSFTSGGTARRSGSGRRCLFKNPALRYSVPGPPSVKSFGRIFGYRDPSLERADEPLAGGVAQVMLRSTPGGCGRSRSGFRRARGWLVLRAGGACTWRHRSVGRSRRLGSAGPGWRIGSSSCSCPPSSARCRQAVPEPVRAHRVAGVCA